LVEVVCDTSFLIHLATKRIKNISNFEIEIGPINFLVPQVVLNELQKLKDEPDKKKIVLATLDFIKDLKQISINGYFADKEIIEYIKKYGGFVGTLDKELKHKVKNVGGSVISFSNDRIVLES
jgi:uncharacterized protein